MGWHWKEITVFEHSQVSVLSSRPYEQLPSPRPFSPFSSSSSKRKLRGTAGAVRCRAVRRLSEKRSAGVEKSRFATHFWP